MTVAEVSQHACDVDPDVVHYAMQPGVKQCGAAIGRDCFDEDLNRINCPDCRVYLKRRRGELK
jgi:hypothetical protein